MLASRRPGPGHEVLGLLELHLQLKVLGAHDATAAAVELVPHLLQEFARLEFLDNAIGAIGVSRVIEPSGSRLARGARLFCNVFFAFADLVFYGVPACDGSRPLALFGTEVGFFLWRLPDFSPKALVDARKPGGTSTDGEGKKAGLKDRAMPQEGETCDYSHCIVDVCIRDL